MTGTGSYTETWTRRQKNCAQVTSCVDEVTDHQPYIPLNFCAYGGATNASFAHVLVKCHISQHLLFLLTYCDGGGAGGGG